MHWTAGMLTRPAGHEAKARHHEAEIEAKKSEAEAE